MMMKTEYKIIVKRIEIKILYLYLKCVLCNKIENK